MNPDILHEKLQNRLLRRLPQSELEEIALHLDLVPMPPRKILQDAGEPIEYMYFVESGLVSLVIPLSTGVDVEVGVVGREGVVNPSGGRTDARSIPNAMGQVEGHVLRLPVSALGRPATRFPALMNECDRFEEYLYAQAAQSAACNRQHEVPSRLARWLLQVRDETGMERFRLTQEFIAEMLGIRRPTVTTAASMLHDSGLITYHRGLIDILDGKGLEDISCECHFVLAEHRARLHGPQER